MNNNVLTEEQLNKVNGGDYGDAERDKSSEAMYRLGTHVEVYMSGFHYLTLGGTVIARQRQNDGSWLYQVDFGEESKKKWFTADELERHDNSVTGSF